MHAGSFDMSEYPVIILKFANEGYGVSEVESLFKELDEEVGKLSGQFVTKTYGVTKFVSSEVRVAIGKGSQALADKYAGRSIGSVVLVDNLIGKMMLQGILLVTKNHTPTKVASKESEADQMLEEMLMNAGALSI